MDDDGYMCLIAGKFHDSSLADEFLCANAPCMAESGLRGVRKRVKVDPLYYGVDSDSDGCDSLLPVGILPRACPSLILFLPIVTLSHNQQFKNEIQIKKLVLCLSSFCICISTYWEKIWKNSHKKIS